MPYLLDFPKMEQDYLKPKFYEKNPARMSEKTLIKFDGICNLSNTLKGESSKAFSDFKSDGKGCFQDSRDSSGVADKSSAFMEQRMHRILVLTSDAGTGKTKATRELAKNFKNKGLSVVELNLMQCENQIAVGNNLDHLVKKYTKEDRKNSAIFFDEVDQIVLHFRKKFSSILQQAVKEFGFIWVTIRTHEKKYLAEELKNFDVLWLSIEEFTVEESKRFLQNLLKDCDWEDIWSKIKNLEIPKTPLILQMLSELLKNEEKRNLLTQDFNIFTIYWHLLDLQVKKALIKDQIWKPHLQVLFDLINVAVQLLVNGEVPRDADRDVINQVGLARFEGEESFSFVHKTYCEFLVCLGLFMPFSDEIPVFTIDLKVAVLTKPEFNQVRRFLEDAVRVDFRAEVIFTVEQLFSDQELLKTLNENDGFFPILKALSVEGQQETYSRAIEVFWLFLTNEQKHDLRSLITPIKVPKGNDDFDFVLTTSYKKTSQFSGKDIIVLIGITGSGKSSTAKFIRRDQSLSIAKNEQDYLNFVDNEVTIGSKDSHTSKTLVHNISLDRATGAYLVDCAGFEDSRSPKKDLIASFLNKLILEKAARLKMVIVENYNKLILGEERTSFLKVLKHVSELLKNNFHSFVSSICLIATKVDTTRKDPELTEAIKVFLNKTLNHLNETNKLPTEAAILKYLLDGDKFAFIRRPDETGSPWECESLMKNWNDVRNLIFYKLDFTEKVVNEFNVTVSPETINWIKEDFILKSLRTIVKLLDYITAAITSDFDNRFRKTNRINLIRYCVDYCHQLSSLQTWGDIQLIAKKCEVKKDVLEDLEFQIHKIQFLYQVTNKDHTGMEDIMITLNGELPKLVMDIENKKNDFIATCKTELTEHIEFLKDSLQRKISDKIHAQQSSTAIEFCNFSIAKLSNINSSEDMLLFSEEQGIETKLIKDLKMTLGIFIDVEECFEDVNKKLASLNDGVDKIVHKITNRKREVISEVLKLLTDNVDSLKDNLVATLDNKIENISLFEVCKFCDCYLSKLRAIGSHEQMLQFAEEHSFFAEDLLVELKSATEVLQHEGQFYEEACAKVLSLNGSINIIMAHVIKVRNNATTDSKDLVAIFESISKVRRLLTKHFDVKLRNMEPGSAVSFCERFVVSFNAVSSFEEMISFATEQGIASSFNDFQSLVISVIDSNEGAKENISERSVTLKENKESIVDHVNKAKEKLFMNILDKTCGNIDAIVSELTHNLKMCVSSKEIKGILSVCETYDSFLSGEMSLKELLKFAEKQGVCQDTISQLDMHVNILTSGSQTNRKKVDRKIFTLNDKKDSILLQLKSTKENLGADLFKNICSNIDTITLELLRIFEDCVVTKTFEDLPKLCWKYINALSELTQHEHFFNFAKKESVSDQILSKYTELVSLFLICSGSEANYNMKILTFLNEKMLNFLSYVKMHEKRSQDDAVEFKNIFLMYWYIFERRFQELNAALPEFELLDIQIIHLKIVIQICFNIGILPLNTEEKTIIDQVGLASFDGETLVFTHNGWKEFFLCLALISHRGMFSLSVDKKAAILCNKDTAVLNLLNQALGIEATGMDFNIKNLVNDGRLAKYLWEEDRASNFLDIVFKGAFNNVWLKYIVKALPKIFQRPEAEMNDLLFVLCTGNSTKDSRREEIAFDLCGKGGADLLTMFSTLKGDKIKKLATGLARNNFLKCLQKICEKLSKELLIEALLEAAEFENDECVDWLWKNGAILHGNNDSDNLLHLAAKEGNAERVKRILKVKNVQIDAKVEKRRTALHWAALYGNEKVVRLLVEAKADVYIQDEDKKTALELASANGHKSIEVLLQK